MSGPSPTPLPRPPPVTRFAPSPTGYLHLGHVASAIYVWGLGRALGGRVLLRIEDHDRGRCRPEYEQAIFADLAWLGLRHDNEDLRLGQPSPYRQSDSLPAYEAALTKLATSAAVYGCSCSRKQLADAQTPGPAADTDGERRYSGRCRERRLPLVPGTSVRVVLPPGELAFDDLALGRQCQEPWRQCGDLLLRDRLGNFTYQYAVTVDDLRQGVTLVVRGQDLTASTGRQVWLARQLGRRSDACFLHHPLLHDATGRKLGKRFWSEAVASRRARGDAAPALLGEAAYLAGLVSEPRPVSADELPALVAILPAYAAAARVFGGGGGGV